MHLVPDTSRPREKSSMGIPIYYYVACELIPIYV